MRFLTGADISSILRNLTPGNARHLLDALSSGLASYHLEQSNKNAAQNRIIQPPRVVFQSRASNEGYATNTVLTMPVSDTDSTVVKVATVPAKGNIAGAITIYSGVTGELQGVLNAAEITAFRTALASMTMLTRWSAAVGEGRGVSVCVFGSGKQAEWHVRLALLLVGGIRRVIVVNRGRTRLEDLERDVLSELRTAYANVKFEILAHEGNKDYQRSLRSVLSDADIICCCTPSTEPLFGAPDLQGGPRERFMSLIGSYKPHMQEIDTETLNLARQSGAKIWVDLKDACLDEAGELIKAGLGPDDLTEIGELFSREGRERSTLDSGRQLTLFKCVGFGFMDLVISKALLEMAGDLRVGMVVEAF